MNWTFDELGIGVASAIIGAFVYGLGGEAITGFRRRMRLLAVDRLWRPLLTRDIAIIMAEYPNEPTAEDPDAKLARNLGIRHFVSKGNANAVTDIVHFLGKELNFYDCSRHGDKTVQGDLSSNLVLIGSPATNKFSAEIFRSITETYDLGFDIEHDESTVRIVNKVTKKTYEPHINVDAGVDYALVLRVCISEVPMRHCLLLCGASMWGVEGAAKVVTSPRRLRRIKRGLSPSNNIAFLVRVAVINNTTQNPEILPIDARGRGYVRAFKRFDDQ